MILLGIAATIRFITVMIMPAEILPPERAGTASGVNISVAYIGALIGPLVTGIILTGNSQDFSTIFYILMGTSAATTVIALLLPGISSKKQS
jgi:MFS family permease